MEFKEPLLSGFTVYSKSGCGNCVNVKRLIGSKHLFYEEVDCDDYLIEDRDGFLKFIEIKAETNYKTFPMVFYDGKFVGGYTHTIDFIDKLLSFEDVFA